MISKYKVLLAVILVAAGVWGWNVYRGSSVDNNSQTAQVSGGVVRGCSTAADRAYWQNYCSSASFDADWDTVLITAYNGCVATANASYETNKLYCYFIPHPAGVGLCLLKVKNSRDNAIKACDQTLANERDYFQKNKDLYRKACMALHCPTTTTQPTL